MSLYETSQIIYTIGHSNMDFEDFITILHQFEIEGIVDVRRFPGSKRFPQFNKYSLTKLLSENNISYHWLGEQLGGYRTGGYEAYTETEAFRQGIQTLIQLALQLRTAIMCAEKLFFRCHRRFIAGELAENNWQVIHIMDEQRTYMHRKLKGSVNE